MVSCELVWFAGVCFVGWLFVLLVFLRCAEFLLYLDCWCWFRLVAGCMLFVVGCLRFGLTVWFGRGFGVSFWLDLVCCYS